MEIRELKRSQRVKGRWLAKLEDGTVLRVGENQIADFSLYPGRDLSQEEIAAVQASVRFASLQGRALELLSRKPQSRRELSRKLQEWGADAGECQEICALMTRLGYLNEEAYAARIVEYYTGQGYGVLKVRDEFYRRGVPRELWEPALAQAENPQERLDALVAGRMRGKEADRKELGKVASWLARRGFLWEEIQEAVHRYGDSWEDGD